MPRRTIGEARRLLERDLLPRVGDYWGKVYNDELDRAEQHAKQYADQHISDREKEIKEVRNSSLRELTEVRDALQSLEAEGKRARIGAAEYNQRLAELRQRQRVAEAALSKAEEEVDEVEEVETSPVEWYDSLSRRMPTLRREFSW